MAHTLAVREDEKLGTWLARPEVVERIGEALGGYLDREMFISHHLIHIQSKPELAECSVASQYQAIHTCAMLGLLAGYQQVALIPRAKQLTVMPQWQGYKALFERVPEVLEARAAVVHVRDVFETTGNGPDMFVTRHTYDPFDDARKIEKLEDIRGAYAVFTFRDGRPPRYHFLTTAYIAKCRQCAQTQNVWAKWFEQMVLKTAFRSAYSRRVVNVDPMVAGRVEAFLRHEDALLGNDPRIVDAPVSTVPALSRSAQLAGHLAGRGASRSVDSAPAVSPTEPRASVTQGPVAEPAAGEIVGEVAGEDLEPTNTPEQSAIGQFLDLLAECKTRVAVERLRDHFTGPESEITITDEERREINIACDSKAGELPEPKPAKQRTLAT